MRDSTTETDNKQGAGNLSGHHHHDDGQKGMIRDHQTDRSEEEGDLGQTRVLFLTNSLLLIACNSLP
jgi:hypothetical protein